MKNLNTPKFWDTQFALEVKTYLKEGYFSRWTPNRFATIGAMLPKPKGTNPINVLDIGCGLGHLMRFLEASNPRYLCYGTDFSPFAISQAQKLDMTWSSNMTEQHKYRVADAYDSTFKAVKFQAVIATDVIEHLDDIPKFLQEIKRVTKKGSTIIITTPEKRPSGNKWSEEHVTEFSRDDLIRTMSEICDEHTYVEPYSLLLESTGVYATDPSMYYVGKIK